MAVMRVEVNEQAVIEAQRANGVILVTVAIVTAFLAMAALWVLAGPAAASEAPLGLWLSAKKALLVELAPCEAGDDALRPFWFGDHMCLEAAIVLHEIGFLQTADNTIVQLLSPLQAACIDYGNFEEHNPQGRFFEPCWRTGRRESLP